MTSKEHELRLSVEYAEIHAKRTRESLAFAQKQVAALTADLDRAESQLELARQKLKRYLNSAESRVA